MAPARRAFRGALAHRRPRVRCRGMHLGQRGGGSMLDLDGMLYFPTTPLAFAGGSSGSAHHTVVVASTLTFTGSSYFAASPPSAPTNRSNGSRSRSEGEATARKHRAASRSAGWDGLAISIMAVPPAVRGRSTGSSILLDARVVM